MPKVKLHARNWRTLGVGEHWDADRKMSGFWLRVRESGARAFGVTYGAASRRRRLTLGNASKVTFADARALAQKKLAAIDLGQDPAEEKRAKREAEKRQRTAGTMDAFVDSFLASREAERWRPKTRQEFERIFTREVRPALGRLRPAEVTRGMLRDLVEAIADGRDRDRPAPYIANRVLQTCKLLWSWGLDRGHVDASPVTGLKKPAEEVPRDIEYSDAEIRRVFAALPRFNPDFRDMIELIFHTGCRLNEGLGLQWSEIDFNRKEWKLPPERSKVGRKKPRSRTIPLTESAVSLLQRREAAMDGKVVKLKGGRYVFPAGRGAGPMARPTKALTEIKTKAKVKDFMPHGVRHTIRARLARLKIPPHIGEAVLGHALPSLQSTYISTGVDFLDEQREALELWERELTNILAKKDDQRAAAQGRS